MRTKILACLALAAVLMLAVSPGGAQQTYYPAGTVSIDLTAAAAGIGISWGGGKLRFQGGEYPFKVGGLSIGSVGVSTVSAVGNVYNLTKLADFPGRYVAAEAGLSLAGGASGLTMRNQKGVIINLYSTLQGVVLTLGPEGFKIDMK
jgi:hypothetical protein